jgi:hypothetical protein
VRSSKFAHLVQFGIFVWVLGADCSRAVAQELEVVLPPPAVEIHKTTTVEAVPAPVTPVRTKIVRKEIAPDGTVIEKTVVERETPQPVKIQKTIIRERTVDVDHEP